MHSKRYPPGQRRFGAHMSIAGGLHLAFERGLETGCDAIQVFVKNQRQWKAKPVREEEVREWKRAWKDSGIGPVVAHGTYLINLAAPDDDLWAKSVEAFADELHRCESLGIPGLVIHPGSHCSAGEEWGITRIAKALDIIHQHTRGFRVKILLEVVAGQGSAIGHRFEQLQQIISRSKHSERLGVCLDTCHLLAAGYDIRTKPGYAAAIQQLDASIGRKAVAVIHTNDSLKPLGSRVDRHAHIGDGQIGCRGFSNFVNDPAFFGIPMLLETPKGSDPRGRDWDRVNLARLRRLVRNVG